MPERTNDNEPAGYWQPHSPTAEEEARAIKILDIRAKIADKEACIAILDGEINELNIELTKLED